MANLIILISKNGEKNSAKDHNFFHVFASHFMKKKFIILPPKKKKNASEFGV